MGSVLLFGVTHEETPQRDDVPALFMNGATRATLAERVLPRITKDSVLITEALSSTYYRHERDHIRSLIKIAPELAKIAARPTLIGVGKRPWSSRGSGPDLLDLETAIVSKLLQHENRDCIVITELDLCERMHRGHGWELIS